MQWDVVIGLEIHAQLATQSKIFSGASTAYGAEPNRQTSPVDIALPGVLRVVHQRWPRSLAAVGCTPEQHMTLH